MPNVVKISASPRRSGVTAAIAANRSRVAAEILSTSKSRKGDGADVREKRTLTPGYNARTKKSFPDNIFQSRTTKSRLIYKQFDISPAIVTMSVASLKRSVGADMSYLCGRGYRA